jgi:hypothetical protein
VKARVDRDFHGVVRLRSMTAKSQQIEQAFKKLPAKEQAELFSRLETIVYAEEEADRISFERDQELASGTIKAISKRQVMQQIRAKLALNSSEKQITN